MICWQRLVDQSLRSTLQVAAPTTPVTVTLPSGRRGRAEGRPGRWPPGSMAGAAAGHDDQEMNRFLGGSVSLLGSWCRLGLRFHLRRDILGGLAWAARHGLADRGLASVLC